MIFGFIESIINQTLHHMSKTPKVAWRWFQADSEVQIYLSLFLGIVNQLNTIARGKCGQTIYIFIPILLPK